MARYKLAAGAYIDLLTKDELDDVIAKQTSEITQQQLRGLKYLRQSMTATVSAGTLLMPGPTPGVTFQLAIPDVGPADGFAWRIDGITVDGLTAAADTLKVYRNAVQMGNFIAQVTGAAPALYNPHRFLLGGETLVISGTGLTSTGQLLAEVEVWEAPQEMMGKLL